MLPRAYFKPARASSAADDFINKRKKSISEDELISLSDLKSNIPENKSEIITPLAISKNKSLAELIKRENDMKSILDSNLTYLQKKRELKNKRILDKKEGKIFDMNKLNDPDIKGKFKFNAPNNYSESLINIPNNINPFAIEKTTPSSSIASQNNIINSISPSMKEKTTKNLKAIQSNLFESQKNMADNIYNMSIRGENMGNLKSKITKLNTASKDYLNNAKKMDNGYNVSGGLAGIGALAALAGLTGYAIKKGLKKRKNKNNLKKKEKNIKMEKNEEQINL